MDTNLKNLSLDFEDIRQKRPNSKNQYPNSLKLKAVDLVNKGLEAKKVANMLKVSRASIYCWRKKLSTNNFVQLDLKKTEKNMKKDHALINNIPHVANNINLIVTTPKGVKIETNDPKLLIYIVRDLEASLR